MKKLFYLSVFNLTFLGFSACQSPQTHIDSTEDSSSTEFSEIVYGAGEESVSYIHVIVALCDNQYQGIVPVGKLIGNGQDPRNNLYWGAAYGIKTYFNKSKEWKLLSSQKVNDTILERLVFEHRDKPFYLIADAYDGRYIKQATEDFVESSAGSKKNSYSLQGKTLGIYGNAQLVAYIGHNGLMDFEWERSDPNVDGKSRDAIILACYSRAYFRPILAQSEAKPMVWSTGLMAPEAYVLHDALSAYVKGESPKQMAEQAAQAYHRYQKCGIGAARRLLVSE